MKSKARGILAFSVDPRDERNELDCSACAASLELHQPDVARPERLLGICPDCHTWTLVDIGVDGRIKLTALPRFE